MKLETKYLIRDSPQQNTTSFAIENTLILAPAYIPEVKGREDMISLLKYSHLLPTGNPIIVPANRWSSDIRTQIFIKGDLVQGIMPIRDFLKSHPIIFYDPPEFYRYTLTKNIVTYSLKGDAGNAKTFYDLLKNEKIDLALKLIHPFFHPFIEKQMHSIFADKEIQLPDNIKKQSNIVDAWNDERVDESFTSYMLGVVKDAFKLPCSTIIPPVPPLMKSTTKATVNKILAINKTTSFLCQKFPKSKSLLDVGTTKNLLPYFHLYIDWDIIDAESYKNNAVVNILRVGLSECQYSGVAVTINGYEKAAKSIKFEKLQSLINEIVNISHENNLPVILPRSNLFGLYFSDLDLQGFSSLLNGNFVYTRPSLGIKQDNKFGKTYLIDDCVELNINDVKDYIDDYGEFPSIDGYPKKPSLLDYSNDISYRINWSKPRRLSHITEAKRIRKSREKGILHPAKLYFEKSGNKMINNL